MTRLAKYLNLVQHLLSLRLKAVHETVSQGFHTGISMMPLLPFISDTTEHLQILFSSFKAAQVNYVLPATITLFGQGPAASKTLMMNAIKKHFPELENRYIQYFKDGSNMPTYYQKN